MNLDQARRELEWELVKKRLVDRVGRGLAKLPSAGSVPDPKELHLELTHRCNLKCVMCEHWEVEYKDPASVGRELTFERIKAMVEGSKKLAQVETVVITGGEPWLRADFADIVIWLSRRLPNATIVALTNFWNTGHVTKVLRRFKQEGVHNLKLGSSLDGLEKTHDDVRGQPGAFGGLVRTVKAVRDEFPEYSFGFTFTVVPRNAHEIFETYRFVTKDLYSGFGAQWAVQTGGIAPLGWTPDQRQAALEGLEAILVDLCARREALAKISAPEAESGSHDSLWSELLYWHYLVEYGKEERRFPFFLRCTSGERHVMVGAEGEVFFCPVNRARVIGDASKEPIDAMWSSKKAQAERDYVASGQCHCWLRCVSTPALDRLLENSRA